jgi:hypothetical protein
MEPQLGFGGSIYDMHEHIWQKKMSELATNKQRSVRNFLFGASCIAQGYAGRPMKLSWLHGCSSPNSGQDLWLPRLISYVAESSLESAQRNSESLMHTKKLVCQY